MHSTSFELEKPHNYPNNTHRKACIFCRTATANQGYFQEVNIPFKIIRAPEAEQKNPSTKREEEDKGYISALVISSPVRKEYLKENKSNDQESAFYKR